jgi:ATP-dependent Lon protease
MIHGMEMEITLPEQIAVMTLPNVTFFPQALLPLHIFEPRYREMLAQSLATDRLFAVAALDAERSKALDQPEVPHRVATLGIVRACQANENGTSTLLLQGIARVEVLGILREEPFRVIKIRALASRAGAPAEENDRLRQSVARLIRTKQRLGSKVQDEFTEFLGTVEDPEAFIDIAAFSLCEDARLKQKLLETLDVHRRLELFSASLRSEIESIKLQRKLQGRLSDDAISDN